MQVSPVQVLDSGGRQRTENKPYHSVSCFRDLQGSDQSSVVIDQFAVVFEIFGLVFGEHVVPL